MDSKRYSAGQIIPTLRKAQVSLSQPTPIAEVCPKLGVSEQSYHRRRDECGGMRVNKAGRLKELELATS